jgi:hypothetical protein
VPVIGRFPASIWSTAIRICGGAYSKPPDSGRRAAGDILYGLRRVQLTVISGVPELRISPPGILLF